MTDAAETNVTWTTALLRRHTPLFLSFVASGQTPERILQETGLPINLHHIRRQGTALQYSQEELANARGVIHQKVLESGLGFFDDFSRQCLASCNLLVHSAETAGNQPLPEPDDHKALEAVLRPYFSAAVALASFLIMMILVQFELEAYLEDFVTERTAGDGDGRETVLGALKMATESTPEVLNLVSLLDLGRHVQSRVTSYKDWIAADPANLLARIATQYPDIWERVRDYERDYGWMGRMYYAGNAISAPDIVLRLQNILRYDCAERLSGIRARREEHLAERSRAIARLDDPQAQLLADIVARYMRLRSERLDAYFIAHEQVVNTLDAAGHALGLNQPRDVIYLDWREITSALRGESHSAGLRATASARQDGFEFSAIDGITTWIAPPGSAHTAALAQQATSGDDLLVGVTANKGHVRGVVRLILSDQDMLDMKPGEILVTTMTTPSLMLAVEKAAGIVTDEGGMLCHAAIVSREFDIPCVIGTTDATRRLRTGDTIDMMAEEGRVKVVSRADTVSRQLYQGTDPSRVHRLKNLARGAGEIVSHYHVKGSRVLLRRLIHGRGTYVSCAAKVVLVVSPNAEHGFTNVSECAVYKTMLTNQRIGEVGCDDDWHAICIRPEQLESRQGAQYFARVAKHARLNLINCVISSGLRHPFRFRAGHRKIHY